MACVALAIDDLLGDRIGSPIQFTAIGAIAVVVGGCAVDEFTVGRNREIGMMRTGHVDPLEQPAIGVDHDESAAVIKADEQPAMLIHPHAIGNVSAITKEIFKVDEYATIAE